MNSYWDAKAPCPAMSLRRPRGNGHDKYYDDNAWLVITFAEAYRVTGDRAYLTRADATARFVASGWDEQLGGGIWWHQTHKDGTKNTCANGPAAVGYLALARLEPPKEAEHWAAAATKTVDWTLAHLQASDGLFEDRVVVATGEVKKGKLTYNSALMLRACLAMYHQTGRMEYLEQAKRIGKAADRFLSQETGVYRDPLKWSHFMVEADLALYRETADDYLMARAKANADGYFAAWKKEAANRLCPTSEPPASSGFWPTRKPRAGRRFGRRSMKRARMCRPERRRVEGAIKFLRSKPVEMSGNVCDDGLRKFGKSVDGNSKTRRVWHGGV